MRLWHIHSRYLDRQGLLAAWREGLLAQSVIEDETKSYGKHPQLIPFREHAAVVSSRGLRPSKVRSRQFSKRILAGYLWDIADEATRREYRFDTLKVECPRELALPLPIPTSQLYFEGTHLLRKLRQRVGSNDKLTKRLRWDLLNLGIPEPRPRVSIVWAAELPEWEKGDA